jgi:hypothetical protein
MRRDHLVLTTAVFLFGLLLIVGSVSAAPPFHGPLAQPTPTGRPATPAEQQRAWAEWAQSAHADTFDNGQGANTTCARCKSPKNWDPTATTAAEQALNCAACKRIPGAARPELEGGVPVAQQDWQSIGCDICHQPVGDSYSTSIAYWNQASGRYEPVRDTLELCAKCHEGRHGFEVVEEQMASKAHQGWACTQCHGAHTLVSRCTSCHDPSVGAGAAEHATHTKVNCTACHDAGGLSIWRDADASSRHYGFYVPVRFAHTLTSWPSHNLQREVRCERCHHPEGAQRAVIASRVSCETCHPNGAVLFWCEYFPRNADPTVLTLKLP